MFRFLLAVCFLIAGLSVSAQSVQTTTPRQRPLPDSMPNLQDKIFEKVEIEPSVDIEAWKQHLQTHLQKVINKAARKRMPTGQYTVSVRFLVEKDGSISEAICLNNPGYGIGEGVEKIIRTGPKWNPGEYRGRKIRSYHTQPITFVITD
jgi:protein TonB